MLHKMHVPKILILKNCFFFVANQPVNRFSLLISSSKIYLYCCSIFSRQWALAAQVML